MKNYIGPIRNNTELLMSIKLSTKIFKYRSKQLSHNHKEIIWKQGDKIDFKNIIIMKNNENKLIGVTRIVPRKFKLGSSIINVCGLTSICIDQKYRSKGLSKKLLTYVLNYVKKMNFDIVILFARKFLDHYYNQFGIFGISHYTSLTLKYSDISKFSNIKYHIRKAKISDLKLIKKSYDFTYLKCRNVFLRNYKYWNFIYNKTILEKKNTIQVLEEKNKFLGYVIKNKNHIYEIGVSPMINKYKLFKSLCYNKKDIEIDIIQNHPILNYIDNVDYIFKFRQCYYGGHMAKILNVNKFRKINKIHMNISDLKKIKGKKLNAALTIKLLGLINFAKFSNKNESMNYLSFLEVDHL